MQPLQLTGERVGVGGGESPSPIGWERVAGRPGERQPPHDVQHVRRSAPNSDRHREQALPGFDPLMFFADFGCTLGFSRRNLPACFLPKII